MAGQPQPAAAAAAAQQPAEGEVFAWDRFWQVCTANLSELLPLAILQATAEGQVHQLQMACCLGAPAPCVDHMLRV